MDAKILIIDDNKSILNALEILLQFECKEVHTISNPNQITSYPNLEEIDVVLLDMNFSAGINSGNEGLFWLNEIKKRIPDLPVIMMTAYGSVDLAVQALKNGAVDFVLKPWNNSKLLATIKATYELRKSKAKINQLKQKENRLKQVINEKRNTIVGNSKAIHEVLQLTEKIGATDVSVLITGENGTGKELIARELHYASKRNNEVFINVDVGTISETLFESELFGHIKGAFTDAKEDRIGKFEAANEGTLFLDEIGNLSLQMQAKLLSVIEQRKVIKVGSNVPIPIDIRLICATNCNLHQMVADGLFREDLLYRINTIQIEVPSLRERGNDIVVLAEFFLNKFAKKYGKGVLKINSPGKEKLNSYHWPGNVRELQHTMERAVILSEDTILKPNDFLLLPPPQHSIQFEAKTLREVEEQMITNSMHKHKGNYTAVANELGISRQTLYNKIKKAQ
ncbi:sigma-54-dependent transcriptional regulator [Tenacibaculum agarivorans]|uniref:sigma-54-dependent transcriptional regulator n=1 Tax=Tenacibaculum agarivorans TaxID=1908389 RepID=UPI000A480C56|nr:sigma-54 dependent transcriptional regulator [Tenacibaculum agarivorans]